MITVLNDVQAKRDRAHVEANVAWLSGPSPVWADGVPVSGGDVERLLRLNVESLRLIKLHDKSTGACQCDPPCGK
jgi:hypothetical protein